MHSNPTLADSDLDGLIDGFEASLGTDPMKMDTDLDGMTDGMEVHLGANPLVPAGSHHGAHRWASPGATPGGTRRRAMPDDDHALGARRRREMH